MLLTPHVFTGVAIGASVQNPIAAVPLSIGMHFLGDAVPHWDFYSNTQKEERRKGWRPIAVMADLAVAIGVGLTATLYALWVVKDPALAINIFLCGIGSVLPDALEGPYIFTDNEPKILKPITIIQRNLQFQAPLPWGILTQIVVILASYLVISNSIG